MFRFSPSLTPGQKAPDFSRPDGSGRLRSLAEFSGRWLVLFFYPADFTSGCTAEACAFRDSYAAIRAAGAEALGISGDSTATHAAFAAAHGLPYPLLSDPGAAMRRAYGVPHLFGRLSGRTSFVIDPQGVIRSVFDSRSRALDHVSKALESLSHAA
jgi:peroxiredoxin Q/BCP